MRNDSSFKIFKSKEELKSAAIEQMNKVTDDYQQATYLYFIARYMVSVFEARFGEIPIQVWNEYRNALDHFFRYKTLEEPKNNGDNSQLIKMEGHIQRATLDILKILSHNTQDSIERTLIDYDMEVLRLVDNQQFIKKLKTDATEASRKFEEAKITDSRLGDESHTDREIVERYLDAAFDFQEIQRMIIQKEPTIIDMTNERDAISNRAAVGSSWHHFKIHWLFYLSWTAVAFLAGNLLELITDWPIWSAIGNWFSS